jgi:cytochrome c oxidase subunit II
MRTPCLWDRATRRRTVAALGMAAALSGAAAAAVRPQPAPAEEGVKTFEVTASRFKFEPAVLEVTEGDTVVLTLRSSDTIHGLNIKALGVKIVIPKTGEPVQVRFQVPRPGTFEIACSEYCGSGHRRMKGQLVVAVAAPAAPTAPKTTR